MPVTPTELCRRLSEGLERGKGVRLSAEEMDLFVVMGGYDALSKYAADWMRKASEDRIAVAAAEQSETLEKAYRAQHPKPHPNPEIEAAARRARDMCQPKKRPRK